MNRDVILKVDDGLDDKVTAIKAARAIFGIGLKEAKDLVESVESKVSHRDIMDVVISGEQLASEIRRMASGGMDMEFADEEPRKEILNDLKAIIKKTVDADMLGVTRSLIDIVESLDPKS